MNKRFGILLAQSPFQMLTTVAAAKEDDVIIDSALYVTVTDDLNQHKYLTGFLPVRFLHLLKNRFLLFLIILIAIKFRLKHPFAKLTVYHGSFYVSTWMHLFTFLVQADTLTFCDDGVSTLLAANHSFSFDEAQKFFFRPLNRQRYPMYLIYSIIIKHNFKPKISCHIQFGFQLSSVGIIGRNQPKFVGFTNERG